MWGLPCPVHYCPGGALLPHLFTLTATVEHLRLRGLAPALPLRPAQSGSACAVHLCAAVYSLWHFPSNGLEPIFPDVIRHTALWSSDFPLFWLCSPGNPASTTRTATIRPDICLYIIGLNRRTSFWRTSSANRCQDLQNCHPNASSRIQYTNRKVRLRQRRKIEES